MAKDQTAILQEISNQLKKMNQTSVREKIQQQSMVERQEAILAGNPVVGGDAAIITPAEDFKRRLKGSLAAAISAEKFTASGKRARDYNKTEAANKKFKKIPKTLVDDKKIGLSTINTEIGHLSYSIGENLLAVSNTAEVSSMLQLNTLDEIALALHTQLDFWKDMLAGSKKDRMDDKRSLLESNREGNKQKVIGQSASILGLPSPSATSKGMGALALRALPGLVVAGVVALAVGAITDFVSGWKADGLAGAVGKGLGGSGEGIWNSIKQSFKVGGFGATIGLAIGSLFGGVGAIPGAIIGGLIGMAIGAVAGYFGGDKITEGLKEAGKAVGRAWESTKGVFNGIVSTIANWIYTPGTKGNHHTDAIKTTMFGGFISWDADNFTIAAAWGSAMGKIGTMLSSIGNWLYNTNTGAVFGGFFTIPDFDMSGFNDGLSDMWDTIRDIPGNIKKSLMGLFPIWMQEGLGWIDSTAPGNITTTNTPKQQSLAQAVAKAKVDGKNIPADLFPPGIKKLMKNPNIPGHQPYKPYEAIAEKLLQQAVEAELKTFDKTAKLMTRNGKSKLGDVIVTPLPDTIITSQKLDMSLKNPRLTPQPPAIITDASTGKGASTTYNSTYIDRNWQSPGTGSNANGVVTESGVIWSW